MLNLLRKKCKLGEYVHGDMAKKSNVICEGSLRVKPDSDLKSRTKLRTKLLKCFVLEQSVVKMI